MGIESKRNYSVESSRSGTIENFRISLNEIIDNEECTEITYSLQQIIDDVMDIKKGGCVYFQPYRDCKESKGIITRIR